MSTQPAASNRFIAYSGEVCRKNGRGSSANCTRAEWMCTSVTGAFTTTGVSTSRIPRSMKKCRAWVSKAARSSSVERVAVGRQSTMCPHRLVAKTSEWLSDADSVTCFDAGQPVDHTRGRDQDHGGSHVETAHLRPFRQFDRGACCCQWQLQRFPGAARGDFAVPDRFHAAHEKGSDQHKSEQQRAVFENADHALVPGKQPRDRCRGHCIDTEQLPRNVPGRAQRPRERHVNSVIVERREIQGREATAHESRCPLLTAPAAPVTI